MNILDKLTTRNAIALGVTGMVLFAVFQMITNASAMIIILQDNAQLVISGAIVFGVLLAKWSDIIQFYFRRKGTEPTPPIGLATTDSGTTDSTTKSNQ